MTTDMSCSISRIDVPVVSLMSIQQRVELGRFPRVEAGGRLVETKQLWTGAHGPRDLEAPLRAIGQVACRVVGAIDQLGLLQPMLGKLDRGLRRPAGSSLKPNRPSNVKPDAFISLLCWATRRFSSSVMPENRRMFWKVRATLALAGISWSGIRSSRNSLPSAAVQRDHAFASACRSR